MQEWKTRERIAGVENAGVKNARATKYGKPSEENYLKYQMKYGCRGFHAYLTAHPCTEPRVLAYFASKSI